MLDNLKVLWNSVTKAVTQEDSNETRVDSARMSHTRLKALARPDYLQPQAPVQELEPEISDLPPLPELTSVVGGHKPNAKPSLAKVSHYRLAAYVASLPEQEREKSKKELEDFCPKG
jgi:hypothetical protein